MKMLDIYKENKKIILLIPPMFATAELMNKLISSQMGNEYRYLIPDLSGFGSAVNQIYKSASKEAKEILNYLHENNINRIKMGFGASLGGVVLMELIKNDDISFDNLFFEGTSFLTNSNLNAAITKMIFLHKHRKAVAHPEIAFEKMEALYGKVASKIMAEQMISLNEESLKNMVWDCAHVNLPEMSLEMQKSCVFAYGEKEPDYKAAKKLQPIKYPAAELRIWPGYDHCTKITEDSHNYAFQLKNEIEYFT